MNPTAAQRRAIESDAKNILVVAGPGSGKTATTVERIAELIDDGADPRKMVALTFTNAAAKELQERLHKRLPGVDAEGQLITGFRGFGFCGTLHGFALRCLKQHGEAIGFGGRTALIGEDAVADLIEAKAKQLGCKTPLKKLLELKAQFYSEGFNPNSRISDNARVLGSYYADLAEAGMVDFDTILEQFLRLLKSGVKLPFTHLFVDEVQDSASIDWDIYWAMPVSHRFFVGDQDQSIYAFRGGRPDLMVLRGDGEILMLEDNFRSNSEICVAAQRLIDHTSGRRYPKATISVRGPGGLVLRVPGEGNSGAEVAEVSRIVRAESAIGSPWPEIAVLARTNSICNEVREQLKADGVPVAEGARVERPRDWNLAKAVVELAANPLNDTLAYFCLLAKERHLGRPEKDARKIANDAQRAARSNMRPLCRELGFAVSDDPRVGNIGVFLSDHQISTETRMRIVGLIRMLPPDADLLQLALAMTQDEGKPTAAETGVTVSTMHGAKGREWDVVVLAGFEEEEMVARSNVDPSSEAVDEARRLAYVAVTRARNRLFITHSRLRKTSWGAVEEHRPCRFLEEMGL